MKFTSSCGLYGLLCFLQCASAAFDDLDVDLPSANVADGELTLLMEQSFDEGSTFERRGLINVHSLRSGSATVEQSDVDRSRLNSLCDAGSLYIVKVNSGNLPWPLRAVADPCALIEHDLNDLVTLHLDWRAQLISVSLAVAEDKNDRGKKLSENKTFKTKVAVQSMVTGPSPDTAAFVQRMEQEKLAKQRGETPDNRSFFAKYWMYIIPVVLFMAMGGGGEGGGR